MILVMSWKNRSIPIFQDKFLMLTLALVPMVLFSFVRHNIADFKMRIFNEDGSEAKNCGNGLRCVAKYLLRSHVCDETSFHH